MDATTNGHLPDYDKEEVIRRMGVELGMAAARIYVADAQILVLQAQRDSLAKALDETSKRVADAARA